MALTPRKATSIDRGVNTDEFFYRAATDPGAFGRLLARARLGRGMSARDLSVALPIAPSTLSLWENGRRIPDVEQLRSICKILHVSADVLLGFTPFELRPMPEGTGASEHV